MIDRPKEQNALRIVALGDVVGRPGRNVVTRLLRQLRAELSAELVIVNGENAAGGAGIDPGTALELKSAGADVVTLGDHAFQRKGSSDLLEKSSDWCIRPYNLPADSTPGSGACLWRSSAGVSVRIVNLLGRVFMGGIAACPFRAVDQILAQSGAPEIKINIFDFHAEATSEKWSMARHLDGRASLLFGTHTHVQTSDAQVLPGGTGYITDLGMTGANTGVIGMDAKIALRRFLSPTPAPYQVADGDGFLSGIVADVDQATGKTLGIAHFRRG